MFPPQDFEAFQRKLTYCSCASPTLSSASPKCQASDCLESHQFHTFHQKSSTSPNHDNSQPSWVKEFCYPSQPLHSRRVVLFYAYTEALQNVFCLVFFILNNTLRYSKGKFNSLSSVRRRDSWQHRKEEQSVSHLMDHYTCTSTEQIHSFEMGSNGPSAGPHAVLFLLCGPTDPHTMVGARQVVLLVAETKCRYGIKIKAQATFHTQGASVCVRGVGHALLRTHKHNKPQT